MEAALLFVKPLDNIPKVYIPISAHPTRGAFCRTLANAGWVRRLRAGLVTLHPGGDGAAQTSLRSLRKRNCYAGTTKSPCQELADRRFVSIRGVVAKRGPAPKKRCGGELEGGTSFRTRKSTRKRVGAVQAAAMRGRVDGHSAPSGAPLPRTFEGITRAPARRGTARGYPPIDCRYRCNPSATRIRNEEHPCELSCAPPL